MKPIAAELNMLLEKYLPALLGISEEELTFKSLPGKWSKKEVVGHLIDSAQNNLRRFIVAQYEIDPVITYQQNEWVRINHYQEQPPSQVIQLWYLVNKQIAAVLENSGEEAGKRLCNAGQLMPIEWLAKDYIKHLRHHIHVVLNIEPVDYP